MIEEGEAKVSLTDHGKKASTIKHGTCLVSIATGGRYLLRALSEKKSDSCIFKVFLYLFFYMYIAYCVCVHM